jgi:hypothetical protein
VVDRVLVTSGVCGTIHWVRGVVHADALAYLGARTHTGSGDTMIDGVSRARVWPLNLLQVDQRAVALAHIALRELATWHQ